MKYFENFPSLYYTFDTSNPEFKAVTDIFTRVKMMDDLITNISVYYNYQMKDSDTIESIAHKYYKDPNRHWIIMFTNTILDPYFQLPLNQDVLEKKIEANYGTLANAQAHVHHVEKRTTNAVAKSGLVTYNTTVSIIDNGVISVDGFTSLPTTANPVISMGANTSVTFSDGTVVTVADDLVAVSNYDYEVGQNEDHRNIKLVRKEFVEQIENELKKLLKT